MCCLAQVCELLTTWPEHPAKPSDGQSNSLRLAAARGCLDLCRLLLDCPHDPADALESNALTEAAAGGFEDVVNLLLSRGAIPTDSAVFQASKHGHVDIVKLLLERGHFNTSLFHALSIAASQGHAPVCALLMDKPDLLKGAHQAVVYQDAFSDAWMREQTRFWRPLLDNVTELAKVSEKIGVTFVVCVRVRETVFACSCILCAVGPSTRQVGDSGPSHACMSWGTCLTCVCACVCGVCVCVSQVRGLSDQELIDIIRRDDMFSFSKRMDQLLALARGETLPPPLPTFPGSGAAGSSSSGPFMYRPRPLPGPSEVRFGSTGARHMWSPSPLGLRTKRERRNVPYGPPPAPFMDFPEPEDPMLD